MMGMPFYPIGEVLIAVCAMAGLVADGLDIEPSGCTDLLECLILEGLTRQIVGHDSLTNVMVDDRFSMQTTVLGEQRKDKASRIPVSCDAEWKHSNSGNEVKPF